MDVYAGPRAQTTTDRGVLPAPAPCRSHACAPRPITTDDFMSRVPYGYKAVPDADFPAETLVDFIAAQAAPPRPPTLRPPPLLPSAPPQARSS